MQMLASSSLIEKSIKGLDLALDEGTDWRKLGFDTGRADGCVFFDLGDGRKSGRHVDDFLISGSWIQWP